MINLSELEYGSEVVCDIYDPRDKKTNRQKYTYTGWDWFSFTTAIGVCLDGPKIPLELISNMSKYGETVNLDLKGKLEYGTGTVYSFYHGLILPLEVRDDNPALGPWGSAIKMKYYYLEDHTAREIKSLYDVWYPECGWSAPRPVRLVNGDLGDHWFKFNQDASGAVLDTDQVKIQLGNAVDCTYGAIEVY